MMQSVEIIVGHSWKQDVRLLKELRRMHRFHTELDLVEIRDIIDIVIDGQNLTSAIAEESVFGILHALLDAVVRLLEGQTDKAIIEFHCEPWEMVLARRGGQFLVSLYGIDRHHRVIAHDVPIASDSFVQALSTTAESLLGELYRISESFSTDTFVRAFSARLARIQAFKRPEFHPPQAAAGARNGIHQGGTSSSNGWTLSYRFDADYPGLREYRGEHDFDLHALMCPGEVIAEVQGRFIPLSATPQTGNPERSDEMQAPDTVTPGGYPLLTAHALLRRGRQLLNWLEAAQAEGFEGAERAHHLRMDIAADGSAWTIDLGDAREILGAAQVRSSPRETLDLMLSLCELLLADLLSLNPMLELNHRWSDLDQEVRELRGWFEELSGSNAYQENPEHFIRTIGHLTAASTPAVKAARFHWPMAKVRALFPRVRWQFAAEQIHFEDIIHAGGALLVGTANALYQIDPAGGSVRWKHERDMSQTRYAMVGAQVLVAPHQGAMQRLDLRSGRTIFEQPAASPQVCRNLLSAAAYPGEDVLVAGDAAGQLFGMHWQTGAPRWDFAPGHGQFVGVDFGGPLIAALSGEGFLFSLNPLDGQVVWKVRLGGLAEARPQTHQGRLYVLTHDPLYQKLTLHALYPFTGRTSWQLRIDGVLAGSASFIGDWLVLPVEQHGQLSLRGIHVECSDPAEDWRLDLASAGMSPPTPVLAVGRAGHSGESGQQSGPLGIVKTDRAQVTCFDISRGEIVWRVNPPSDTWLLHGNVALAQVEDAVLVAGEDLQLYELHSGRHLHTLQQPLVAPELVRPFGALSLLVGARGARDQAVDLLSGLRLEHFLARVK